MIKTKNTSVIIYNLRQAYRTIFKVCIEHCQQTKPNSILYKNKILHLH